MRALLRPLSLHTVFSPIETIVFVFVLATLAYFHILDGIKHSSFFAPTFPSTLKPAYARLSGSEWIATSEREWYTAAKRGQDQAVELQQIVFGLDEKARKVSVVAVALGLLSRVGATSAQPRPLRPIIQMGGSPHQCNTPSPCSAPILHRRATIWSCQHACSVARHGHTTTRRSRWPCNDAL